MFGYLFEATGEPKGETTFAWHTPDNMPRTKHGKWELDQVKATLEKYSSVKFGAALRKALVKNDSGVVLDFSSIDLVAG